MESHTINYYSYIQYICPYAATPGAESAFRRRVGRLLARSEIRTHCGIIEVRRGARGRVSES